jgi:hypothetical protein
MKAANENKCNMLLVGATAVLCSASDDENDDDEENNDDFPGRWPGPTAG